MPRVVPDQREKFDNDELFRKMSRESEVSAWVCHALLITLIDNRYATALLQQVCLVEMD